MTRNIWFISDTHFGHKKILTYSRPQFASLIEMEAKIIANWNQTIKPNDLVYHLGDFARSNEDVARVRPLLHGTIRLIVGNHDDIPKLVSLKLFQRMYLWRVFPEIGVTISHMPLRSQQLRRSYCNLHGHVHGRTVDLEYFHRDVSVESTDYMPVHYDEVAAWSNRIKEGEIHEGG